MDTPGSKIAQRLEKSFSSHFQASRSIIPPEWDAVPHFQASRSITPLDGILFHLIYLLLLG
jgi:hypothetical protein